MPAAVNGMKECTKCGETKDVSEYGKCSSLKDGLKGKCKECRRQTRLENRDKINTSKRQRYKDDGKYRERIRKQNNDWLDSNREEVNRKNRERYQNDEEYREKVLSNGASYRAENVNKVSQLNATYRAKNKKALGERNQKYRKDMSAAVYAIRNTLNGKSYIGQSVHYPVRFRTHKFLLRNNKHDNSKLQFDFNLYGEDVFEFSIVYEFPPWTHSSILLEQEKVEIAKRLQKGDKLYNSQFPSIELLESNVIEVDFAPDVLNLMISVCDEEGITFQDMASIMNTIQERNPNLDILTKINNSETKEET